MCQLLGMNCNVPTDIHFSFQGFRARGGLTDHHEDGFGIAFFEQSDCGVGLRVFHDDKPSHLSPIADLIGNYPIRALNVVAHIRKATQGNRCLANTHPFVRELWGEQWVFAHNGQMNRDFLAKIQQSAQQDFSHYQAVGNTDSERVFCYLLNQLKQKFPKKPQDSQLFAFLTEQCREFAKHGLFNCLLSNGNWQLAYASSLLFYLTRQAPFGEAVLSDHEVAINFADVTTAHDRVTVFATIPLTSNEIWQQLSVNECLIFRDGAICYQDRLNDAEALSIEQGIAMARRYGTTL
ncbi:class II glutamine amidotransferase [Acinetobacter sp. c3-l95]|uniref:class II glutamine amidotransferase n=1 Tax=Acinetobacter sp. c3-l95 TaxID=3342804 RepID=UPI0035B86AF5